MRVAATFLSLFLLSVVVHGAPSSSVVMEPGVWRGAPEQWVRQARADSTELITLTVAVTQPATGKAALEDHILRVSDPTHPDFSQHLTREEVHELLTPTTESQDAVFQWLEASGVSADSITTSLNNDLIQVTVPVAAAERLLRVEYHLYAHTTSSIEVLRTNGEYSLPSSVAPHVDFVRPTIGFPVVQKRPVSKPDALFVTPKFLRDLYNCASEFPTPSTTNIQSFASFLEQFWSEADLKDFEKEFANYTSVIPTTFGPNKGLPGTEANLDSQYIVGVAAGLTTWAYSTAGRSPSNPENEPFLTWLQFMNGQAQVPWTVSVSYGDTETSVGKSYATRVNVELQKIGARGVSVMFAAGDSGAGGNCSATPNSFDPNFPVGSPWVTGVGGLIGGTVGKSPTGEEADSISGGGFSNWWPRPSWQDTAVKGYFNNAKGNKYFPASSFYNSSGRGYPDVAAQSEGFLVSTYGIPLPVAGTSCASPTFTAVIGLVNEARIKAGKNSLGFLNPFIYSTAAKNPVAFNDAVKGVNYGCTKEGTGFPAVEGWDPVTGFGSPNYAELVKEAMALP